MSDKLKPCPSCGNKMVLLQDSEYAGFSVLCGLCGVRGPVCSDHVAASLHWNKMPRNTPEMHALLDQLQNVAQRMDDDEPIRFRSEYIADGWISAGQARAILDARRPGFTLIEQLVVIAIISMTFVLGVVVFGVTRSQRLRTAASMVDSAIEQARDRAMLAAKTDARSEYAGRHVGGLTGVRITRDRLIPLYAGSTYAEGKVSVRSDWPEGFTPPYRRLVLEEAKFDAAGKRNNPTSWYYNVRLGDAVRVSGHDYIVCGPMEAANAEGYVTIGAPGSLSPLDRGYGPVEFLYLVDAVDDNLDGIIDSGWNGLNDDLDGYTDEDDEWEVERWQGLAAAGLESVPYSIMRRPSPMSNGAKQLPAGVVVDFAGSTFWGKSATDSIDVAIDQYGMARPLSPYALAQTPLAAAAVSLRLCELADETSAITLTVDAASGRVTVEEQDEDDE